MAPGGESARRCRSTARDPVELQRVRDAPESSRIIEVEQKAEPLLDTFLFRIQSTCELRIRAEEAGERPVAAISPKGIRSSRRDARLQYLLRAGVS